MAGNRLEWSIVLDRSRPTHASLSGNMTTECARIADQLRNAYGGDPWHGSPLTKILEDVSAEQAAARPFAGGHSIWELALHVQVWTAAAADAVTNIRMPNIFRTERDWPPVRDHGAMEWEASKQRLFETAERLAAAIDNFGDERLVETVPGRDYDYYYLFHGVVQHSLYHGGQMALLKKAA